MFDMCLFVLPTTNPTQPSMSDMNNGEYWIQDDIDVAMEKLKVSTQIHRETLEKERNKPKNKDEEKRRKRLSAEQYGYEKRKVKHFKARKNFNWKNFSFPRNPASKVAKAQTKWHDECAKKNISPKSRKYTDLMLKKMGSAFNVSLEYVFGDTIKYSRWNCNVKNKEIRHVKFIHKADIEESSTNSTKTSTNNKENSSSSRKKSIKRKLTTPDENQNSFEHEQESPSYNENDNGSGFDGAHVTSEYGDLCANGSLFDQGYNLGDRNGDGAQDYGARDKRHSYRHGNSGYSDGDSDALQDRHESFTSRVKRCLPVTDVKREFNEVQVMDHSDHRDGETILDGEEKRILELLDEWLVVGEVIDPATHYNANSYSSDRNDFIEGIRRWKNILDSGWGSILFGSKNENKRIIENVYHYGRWGKDTTNWIVEALKQLEHHGFKCIDSDNFWEEIARDPTKQKDAMYLIEMYSRQVKVGECLRPFKQFQFMAKYIGALLEQNDRYDSRISDQIIQVIIAMNKMADRTNFNRMYNLLMPYQMRLTTEAKTKADKEQLESDFASFHQAHVCINASLKTLFLCGEIIASRLVDFKKMLNLWRVYLWMSLESVSINVFKLEKALSAIIEAYFALGSSQSPRVQFAGLLCLILLMLCTVALILLHYILILLCLILLMLYFCLIVFLLFSHCAKS